MPKYRRIFLAIVASLFLVFALLWPLIKAHLRATILVKQLSEQRLTRVQRMLNAPIQTQKVLIPSTTEPIEGHLYGRTRGKPGAGIVFVHGFSPLGDDYPGLVRAAENLASSGFTVLTPTIPNLTRYLVDEQSVRMIGESSRWLAKLTGGPVSVIGISFSGALALVSAGQPEYKDSFRQVIALSTYDDLERLIDYYLTGFEPLPQGGIEKIRDEDAFGIAIAAMQFLHALVPAADVPQVRETVRRSIFLRQTGRPEDPHLFDSLTTAQKIEAQEILFPTAALKQKIQRALVVEQVRIRHFSPHWQVGSLTVPVTVIAGYNDVAIPTAESMWIARDVPEGCVRRLLISKVIQHVAIKSASGSDLRSRVLHLFQVLGLIHALAPAMQAADPLW